MAAVSTFLVGMSSEYLSSHLIFAASVLALLSKFLEADILSVFIVFVSVMAAIWLVSLDT